MNISFKYTSLIVFRTATSTATVKTESPSSTLERDMTGGHTIRERTQSLTEHMVRALQYNINFFMYQAWLSQKYLIVFMSL